MKLVITATDTRQTLTLSDRKDGSFLLSPDTQVMGTVPIDFSGVEFSGDVGGYNLASRQQRRPLSVSFAVVYHWTDKRSILEKVLGLTSFFAPHNPDLSVRTFDVDVYDCSGTSFRLLGGAISSPLETSILVGDKGAACNIGFIFPEPTLYKIGGNKDRVVSAGNYLTFTSNTARTIPMAFTINGIFLGIEVYKNRFDDDEEMWTYPYITSPVNTMISRDMVIEVRDGKRAVSTGYQGIEFYPGRVTGDQMLITPGVNEFYVYGGTGSDGTVTFHLKEVF